MYSTRFLLALVATAISAINPCVATIVTMSTANTTTKQGCPHQCGNVTIPYPFGIGLDSGCSLNPFYDVFCDITSDLSTPFLIGRGEGSGQRFFEILDISETRIRVRNGGLAISCFNSSGQETTSPLTDFYFMSLTPNSPFTFSSASNLLTVVGCSERGLIYDGDINSSGSNNACNSNCLRKEDVVANQCNGAGCCEAPVPKGLRSIDVFFGFGSNNTDVVSFNPCGYAFVAEQGWYNFGGLKDLNDPNLSRRVLDTIPFAIDWVIGNGTCDEARENPSSYACKENASCSDNVENRIGGYTCSCKPGFEGNPYLSPGCSDIDECADGNLSNCSMTCRNTKGSYRCSCPRGYTGDGRKNGSGCTKESSQDFVLKLCLGISSVILFLVIGISWLCVMDRKRKLIETKKKFFEQNGGWLLQEQVSTAITAGNSEPTKIFTEEELKTATNDFDKDRILGNGGYGTVYKGVLSNNRIVAIKKSKLIDRNQVEQFINEVVILGQINHCNVVKLLGCCLETEVPLLVYEFISNGTLYNLIHESQSYKLTWSDCLRIASEAADALAYLHSAASPPIIHRDIKSMNILLDDDYNAKIADFGASRLIPMDQSQLSTLVQGTLGYLDPEYFHSSLLTEKSDVYSFGVVLAELLTMQKPLSPIRAEKDRNLATYFVRSIEEETLFDVLYPQWLREASTPELVSMASIAERCVKLSGKDRPTMREVFMEVEAVKKLNKNQTVEGLESKRTETTISLDEEADMYPIPIDAIANMWFEEGRQHTTEAR